MLLICSDHHLLNGGSGHEPVPRRHVNTARAALAKAIQGLQKLQADDMDAQDVARLIDLSAKLERLALGEATEHMKQDVRSEGSLTLEIVERLCSHVAIIHKGKLVANGSLEELRAGVATSLGESELGEQRLTLEEIFLNVVGAGAGDSVQELSWL